MKTFRCLRGVLIVIIFSFCTYIQAQKLSFDENGEFKILKFTYMHYSKGNLNSDTTLILILEMLDEEKPDLVVFTGDIVTGSVEGWNDVTKFVIEREIPFAVTLGNHDNENGVTREEISKLVTSLPYNVNTHNVMGGRVLNDVIPIYKNINSLNVSALIYCFDSGAYSSIEGVGGYGWITTEQIDWYKKQSIRYTLQNNFKPLPALAYFHIPLPEYRTAFDNDKNIRYGVRLEDECPSELNSGMFLAMKEMRMIEL